MSAVKEVSPAVVEQRRAALVKANRMRVARKEIKQQLRGGEIQFSDIDPWHYAVAGMKIIDLLRGLPWQRRAVSLDVSRMTEPSAARAHALLRSLRIPSHARCEQIHDAGLWEKLCYRVKRDCITQG